MAFITGLILLDAPASALNNAGGQEGARTENAVGVKFIKSKQGAFPYVSAQSFRYWLRTTLEKSDLGWKDAPIFREKKIAYTDANPLEYWDDDLFGYMKAQSKKADAVQKRSEDVSRAQETPTNADITRVSPFRVSTLVSIAPVSITDDFGTMSRHEGDPVPHEHQFYKTVLKGLFSLDLFSAGTFSYKNKTGFRNLDDVRIEIAKKDNLEHLEEDKSYRLPLAKRLERISAVLKGLGVICGGAKQAIHYTDVTPSAILIMVTKGGNHPLQYVIGPDSKGLPAVTIEGLRQMAEVWKDQILSPLYIGWIQGFYDDQRKNLEQEIKNISTLKYELGHPREILNKLITELNNPKNQAWLNER